MTRYALVNDNGSLNRTKEFGDRTPPDVSHKGYSWYPIQRKPQPSVPDGSIAEQNNTLVSGVFVFDWTVRPKTVDELTDERAEKDVLFDSFANTMETDALGHVLFEIANEIRTLKSQPTLTRRQFRNWIRGLL